MGADPPVIPPVLRQHAEGAAFLWSQRAAYFHEPAISEIELGRLDRRLAAHVAGLLASGDKAIDELQAQLDAFPQRGEAFALFVTALLRGDAVAVGWVLDRAAELGNPVRFGLCGAVAWAGVAAIKEHVSEWSRSRDALRRYLAVAALSHHRVNPRGQLDRLLADSDASVRARVLRLLGELGRGDQIGAALAALEARTEFERVAAARSLLLLGRREEALRTLREVAEAEGELADTALELIVASGDSPELRNWLGRLMRNPTRRESAVVITGVIADPSVLDWLIGMTVAPETSAAAGRALRLALDFDLDDTDAFEPDPARLGPGFADRDDGPWPVPERVRSAIREHRGKATFRSLPAFRYECLRNGMAAPGQRLAEWRHRRVYPAWS